MGNKEIEMAFNSIKLNKSEVLINKSCTPSNKIIKFNDIDLESKNIGVSKNIGGFYFILFFDNLIVRGVRI